MFKIAESDCGRIRVLVNLQPVLAPPKMFSLEFAGLQFFWTAVFEKLIKRKVLVNPCYKIKIIREYIVRYEQEFRLSF